MVQTVGHEQNISETSTAHNSTWIPMVVLILGCIPFVFITDLNSDNGNPLRKEIK